MDDKNGRPIGWAALAVHVDLTEMRIPQEQGTPLYIDSASTVFVAQSRGAVKKSAWIRRRVG